MNAAMISLYGTQSTAPLLRVCYEAREGLGW
jgi:hypothetical protein